MFILGRHGPGEYSFRLAGGLLAQLHGRELRGANFIALWAPHGRLPIQTALEQRRRRPAPLVISLEAQAGGSSLPVEIGLMPMADKTDQIDRFLGIYDPRGPLARLRDEPVERLSLIDFAKTDDDDQPRLRLAALGGLSVD